MVPAKQGGQLCGRAVPVATVSDAFACVNKSDINYLEPVGTKSQADPPWPSGGETYTGVCKDHGEGQLLLSSSSSRKDEAQLAERCRAWFCMESCVAPFSSVAWSPYQRSRCCL